MLKSLLWLTWNLFWILRLIFKVEWRARKRRDEEADNATELNGVLGWIGRIVLDRRRKDVWCSFRDKSSMYLHLKLAWHHPKHSRFKQPSSISLVLSKARWSMRPKMIIINELIDWRPTKGELWVVSCELWVVLSKASKRWRAGIEEEEEEEGDFEQVTRISFLPVGAWFSKLIWVSLSKRLLFIGRLRRYFWCPRREMREEERKTTMLTRNRIAAKDGRLIFARAAAADAD